MLVTDDEIFGSIGGGVMEVEMVERARLEFKVRNAKYKISTGQSQIESRKSQIFELVHRKNDPNSSGMICSGKQTVIMQVLDPADIDAIEQLAAANEPVGLRLSHRGLEIADDIDSASPRFEQNGDEFVYEEKIGAKSRLFIIGGGHCAMALSELMTKLDFRIELFDDRADLNTLRKNTFADKITIVGSYDEIAEHIPEGEDVYVVVMTLGYKFDEIVIRRLFGKRFRYFGVLGSRAKMKTLLNSLKKEGFNERLLAEIRTPVGLPINSRTPEEIAVSIAAEIISVKNRR